MWFENWINKFVAVVLKPILFIFSLLIYLMEPGRYIPLCLKRLLLLTLSTCSHLYILLTFI